MYISRYVLFEHVIQWNTLNYFVFKHNVWPSPIVLVETTHINTHLDFHTTGSGSPQTICYLFFFFVLSHNIRGFSHTDKSTEGLTQCVISIYKTFIGDTNDWWLYGVCIIKTDISFLNDNMFSHNDTQIH